MTLKICKSIVLSLLLVALGMLFVNRAAAQSAAQRATPSDSANIPARITQEIDDTQRIVLKGHVHPLARAEFDRGAVADSQPATRVMLLLQRSPEQETSLHQLLGDQQNKASRNFHAWLTPEQFGKQFGPADSDIQAVTQWLTSHGFQNIKVHSGRTVVEFAGNVGQLRSAFGTEIHHLNVRGESHFATFTEPQIPAALAPVVKGFAGLHNFRPKSMSRNFGTFRRTSTGEVRPLFTYADSNGTFFAMGPQDFAKIYNIPLTCGTPAVACDGSGQSIAVVGQSNINLQDVRDFRLMFGLPANDPLPILNGPDPGLVPGDEGESDLDVEWSGAVAPKAQIFFVITESTQTDFTGGIDGSALYIIDNNVAPILSESYGQCEAFLGSGGNAFYNALWQQAAAEGITVSISAGDNGSAGCDDPNSQTDATHGVAVSGLASTPFNVALGGTDFDYSVKAATSFWSPATTPPTPQSALGYIPETTWNDSCANAGITGCTSVKSTGADLVAGSGGPSSCSSQTSAGVCTGGYAKPSWQTGTPGMLADGVRDLPDVSLFSADGKNNSFYVVCESDQDPAGGTGCNLTTSLTSGNHDFQGVGGTSAAAPSFAGIMALVNQATKQRQGNANYVLYALAKSQSASLASCNSTNLPLTGGTCAFNDITKGNISVACAGGSTDCSNKTSGQFGAVVTGPTSTTPAWGTTTGYDLATGLGSVNVANLLSGWAAATPSTIATGISSFLVNPTAFAVDASTTVSGTITHATGTAIPTGIVSLYQGNTNTGVVIDSFTLTGAAFSFSSTLFPAGNYSVIAHYGGDGTYAPGDSSPIAVNVTAQASSKTVVSFVTFTNANPPTPILNTGSISVPYGSPYILRVDVQNAAGQICENLTTFAVQFVCPTGHITLFNGTTPLNDFPTAQTPNATNLAKLNDRGFVEDQPIQLPAGAYNIVAKYSGDGSYPASVSTGQSVTITQAATTTVMVPIPGTVTSGSSVAVTASVSSNSNSSQGPTGNVQFFVGSTALGSPVACTPAGASASAGASCTATTNATLSMLLPPGIMNHPRPAPPVGIFLLLAALAILMFYIASRLTGVRQRRYVYAAALLLIASAIGVAGCGGGSGGGGGVTTHTDSVSAKYLGDTNYAASPQSTAIPVTVQ